MEIASEFEIWAPLIGGIIIGVSSILLFALRGRIMGCSGIVSATINTSEHPKSHSLMIISGMIIGGVASKYFIDEPFESIANIDMSMLIIAGFIVGIGTKIGNGCTSGHGISGMSRLSLRSTVAVCCFMAAGAVTVYIMKHMMGGL